MPSLFVVAGPDAGRWFPVDIGRTIVGRGKTLPARLHDDRVSRRHLEIRYDDERRCHIASDMASANGVYLNDRRIHDPTTLIDGTLIRIGGTRLLFISQDFDNEATAAEHFRSTVEPEYGRLPPPGATHSA